MDTVACFCLQLTMQLTANAAKLQLRQTPMVLSISKLTM